jgi:hypothetical protein
LTEQSISKNDRYLPVPGKIAVITGTANIGFEEYHSADLLASKYGADKIIHVTWPETLVDEYGKMVDTVASLATDREIRVLIINQAIKGCNAAVDKLKEARNDIFIAYLLPHDPYIDSARRANLVLQPNQIKMGQAMVRQARKQGAWVFVHYSFPRHRSISIISSQRELIRETCVTEGIRFVDAAALDPRDEAGIDAAKQFIIKDVPKLVAKYGESTAFYCTNCTLQAPLIKAVVDCHAIYPQPCCPSPYHGFPEALGIDIEKGLADLSRLILEASDIAESKNMTDRLSTWPVSVSMMSTSAGTEYAIKWINGEVPKTGIDSEVLAGCMNSYVIEVVGEESSIFVDSYSENGVVYDNFKLILMSYLDL